MDPISLLGVASLVGVGWWMRRSARTMRALPAPTYEDEADVALHVAKHEVEVRKQPWSPIHLLYGLLQDEAVVAAVRASGADPELLEDRTMTALDELLPLEGSRAGAEQVVRYALVIAGHHGRRVSCVDLWAGMIRRTGALADLFAAAGVDPLAVLFRLSHGAEPPISDSLAGTWDVVFHNDDYTTKEFVCRVLEEVFALTPADAQVRMAAVHEQGRAAIVRHRAAEARAKVLEARRRAKAEGYPLWIALEPT